MEVQKEAQRIMTMSVWKMYHSRMQRGGLRLHRSLQLSLVMRNARDLYLSAKLDEEDEAGPGGEGGGGGLAAPPPSPAGPLPPETTTTPRAAEPEPMETQQQQQQQQEEPRGGPAPPPARTRWSRRAPGPPPGAAKPSRKRRSSSLGKLGAAEAGLVPSKKAKLADEEEEGGERQPQRQEGPFPSLARVLQDRFSALALPPPKGAEEPRACRGPGDGVLSIMLRAVVAF